MKLGEQVGQQPAGNEAGGNIIIFPMINFSRRFDWPLRTFPLPRGLREGMQMGRTTLRVKEFISAESCIVYVKTDAHVQVLSQEEIETSLLCQDKPSTPNQKRKGVEKTLSMTYPTLWIGQDIAVDYTGHEGEYASFCLRTRKRIGSLIPTEPKKNPKAEPKSS